MSGATGAAPALPAAGSSFYWGMRVLPKARREAMYAVYAFCRAVDDVADDGGPRDARRAELDAWRDDVRALYRGEARPRTAALRPHVAAFGLPAQAFQDVIDGMAMDVEADIQAPDAATLDLYCDRVASAVGRLSSRIFGLPEKDGDDLAHHLGRALQLTNILRDLDDDASIGRLYLPADALRRAGMTDLSPAAVLAHPRLGEAAAEALASARAHFDRADAIMSRQPPRLVRAPRLMEAAYRAVLDRLEARGFAAPRAPVRTPKGPMIAALLRHGFAR